MRNPMRRGQGGQLERREMGSSARAESWHGGSERWGMWPALGGPPHQTGAGPCPFLICLRDTMLPMVNPTCVGVLVCSRAMGGCGSLTALSGPRGEGGPSSGPCFKGAQETSIIKTNILMQIVKNQKSVQKILMSKMLNFRRKRAQVLLICSLVSGLCWLPLQCQSAGCQGQMREAGAVGDVHTPPVCPGCPEGPPLVWEPGSFSLVSEPS